MASKFFSKDLYAILGVSEEASEKDIVKGYRKKALKCHPDKNPDNPKAAELFHELSEALEVLTDAAARTAYDQSRKAKKAVLERNKVLDSKRKKFKEDLEAREQAAFEQTQKQREVATEQKLAAEIARLRKDGSRLLEQEQERLREELRKQASQVQINQDDDQESAETARVKLKWKAEKDDPGNGGYTSDYLRNLLGCYGQVSTLLMSAKRNGSAIVEFEATGVSADILQEKGHKENPLSMVWLSGQLSHHNKMNSDSVSDDGLFGGHRGFHKSENLASNGVKFRSAGGYSENLPSESISQGSNDNKDFESLVLMRMRQAEERKRLIEQMMKEDDAG
ncbi:Dnaj homolog subfamily c member 17-like [Plakobranchus ocellatus]|uniref:DnaJ homolog subfamily C member 17 n=1 Tax=Plakobranchus ocellatus TaxID=259542 RepID=A0AAV3ZIU7_9GAST|nr:Dnaj homolog subfamily c member 17-like [Plakobranchus ocellatus]